MQLAIGLHSPEDPVATILEQIAAGDQTAMERCLDEFGGLVWELARRYLRSDRAEIEDAVQEVFTAVWLAAPRYDPARGSSAAFVATIAHRRLIDYRRRLGKRAQVRMPEDLPGNDGPPGPTQEDLDRLGEEFARLPEDERTALWFVVARGLSHHEIAQATGAPIGTVKTRLRRAVLRVQGAWRAVTEAAGTGRAT